MNNINALQLCLFAHLIGLIMFAGLSLAHMLAYKNFWEQLTEDKSRGITLFKSITTYQRYRIIGAILLIVAGIYLMQLTHGIYNKQIWMQIKMGLVLLIALTGPVLSRPPLKKLKNLILGDTQLINVDLQIMPLKKRINLAIIIELILIASIVFLSVFKFN